MTRRDPGTNRGPDQISHHADPATGYPTPLTLGLTAGPESTPVTLCARCGGRIFDPAQQSGDRHAWCVDRDAAVWSPPTSHRAAKAPRKPGRLDELVLGALERAGGRGLIDEEIAERLPAEHPGSVSKARLHLVRLGLVRDTGRTRPTYRQVDAAVWVVVR